jgi:Bacterial Ig-like domain (group 2)
MKPAKAVSVFCILMCCALLANCGSGGSHTPTLNQISVTPAGKSIAKGTSLALTATGLYSDGTAKNLTASVTWQASPATVAAVNTQGSVSGKGVGTAEVTATYETVTGSAALTVGAATLTRITVTAPESSLPLDETEQLSATGTYTDGTTQNLTSSVTWQAGPTNIAAVSAQGQLKGLNQGAAQISAAYQNLTGTAAVTVGAAALVQISVSAPHATLPLGESEALSATGTFSNGNTQNLTGMVTWQAGPTTVASVSAQGSLKGLNTGVAQISAAYQGVTGTAAVTVGSAALVSIAVSGAQSSLPLGEGEPLTAIGTFSNGTTQNITTVATWQSNPATIVSVTPQGNLSAIAKGTAQISAAYQGVSGTMGVSVGAAVLLRLDISPDQASLPIGENATLMAVGTFSDGSTQNLTQAAAWSSSQPAVASVTAPGAVAGKTLGAATIQAAVGSINATAGLTVAAPVIVGVTISPSQSSLIIGGTNQLQAVANYSDGSTQNVTATATWTSEDPLLATVINNGFVTANQIGTATIQAEQNGFTGSGTVTVAPMMMISYFNRNNAAGSGYDSTIQLVNPGSPPGDICAMIYVFDSNQEMNECCGCVISDSGLLTLSLLHNLSANPLTGTTPGTGTVEIFPANVSSNGQCNAGTPTPSAMLAGWQTNAQAAAQGYQVSEIPASVVSLGPVEEQVLTMECGMIQTLGSGTGVCSCGTTD